MVASFEQSSLDNGLVSFRNKKKVLEQFIEAITAFHRTGGPDFRAKCPQVPSSLVIAFTLCNELEHNDADNENGVVDPAMYVLLCHKCFVNAAILDQHLQKYWT